MGNNMLFRVHDTMLNHVSLFALEFDLSQELQDFLKAFAIVDFDESFYVFQDEHFRYLITDILQDIEKDCSSASRILKTFLLSHCRKRLTWEACRVKVSIRHFTYISPMDVIVKYFR